MASIVKRGSTYRITVSNGYDCQSKKLLETMTFVPDPRKTEKQNQKALNQAAVLFETRVKNGTYLSGEKITFKDFAEKWMKEYAEELLEKNTYVNYRYHLECQIYPAIGHLKLSDVKPLKLTEFFNSLSRDGIRTDCKKGGYSENTIRKIRNVVSSVMSGAVEW